MSSLFLPDRSTTRDVTRSSSLFLPNRSTARDVTRSSYADRYSETDKLLVAQRLNEFLEFDGTRKFVTLFRKLMNQVYLIHTLTQYLRFIVLLSSKSILGKQVTAIYLIKKDSYTMREVHSLYSPSAVSAQSAKSAAPRCFVNRGIQKTQFF